MNLNDYEAPKTLALLNRELAGEPIQIGDWTDLARANERESAAWRAVAEILYDADWRDIDALCDAFDAFDALKAELEQP